MKTIQSHCRVVTYRTLQQKIAKGSAFGEQKVSESSWGSLPWWECGSGRAPPRLTRPTPPWMPSPSLGAPPTPTSHPPLQSGLSLVDPTLPLPGPSLCWCRAVWCWSGRSLRWCRTGWGGTPLGWWLGRAVEQPLPSRGNLNLGNLDPPRRHRPALHVISWF